MAFPYNVEHFHRGLEGLKAAGLQEHEILQYFSQVDETPESNPALNRMKKVFNAFKSTGNVLFRVNFGVPLTVPKPLDSEIRPGESAQKLMGGLGLTGRTVDDSGEWVEKEALSETSKIVILGNGFSSIPLRLANRHLLGSLAHPPVVLDRINYPNYLADLHRLDEELGLVGLPPLSKGLHVDVISELVSAHRAGNIRLLEYVVGSGNPPEPAKNAGLAINIYGPSYTSLGEQLSFLRPGGRLITTQIPYMFTGAIPGFSFERKEEERVSVGRFRRETITAT